MAVRLSEASLRLEGLQSTPAVDDLLEGWARGDVSDEALEDAERQILAGEPVHASSLRDMPQAV